MDIMLLLSVNGFDCVLLDVAIQRSDIELQRTTDLDAGDFPQPGLPVDCVHFEIEVLGMWGQIQPFAETRRAERTANQSASNQQLPFLLVIAAKSAQNLTPSRKNIFLPDASEPPGVVESIISVLANGFLPRTWGGVGLYMAKEAGLARRSGPDGSRRPECVLYCSNSNRVSM
jgi:hypothetical protein